MNKDFNTSNELDTLTAKLKNAIKSQEMMKAANKVIKTANPEKTIPLLVALGFTEAQASKAVTKDFAGRIGFPAYMLTNNNADIKRWQIKVDLLQKKVDAEERGGNQEFEFTGGTCVYNFSYDRLQLIFDVIPAEELRKKMKEHGFVFAPTESAWQRSLTETAVWKAGQVTDAILPTLAALAKQPMSKFIFLETDGLFTIGFYDTHGSFISVYDAIVTREEADSKVNSLNNANI